MIAYPVSLVPERLRDAQPDSVASGAGDRQSASGHDDCTGLQHLATRELYGPSGASRADVFDGGVQQKPCALLLRELQQPIADVTGALGCRKELC